MAELSEELRSQWHPSLNLPLTPESVNSTTKVWWIGECGHEWESTVSNRMRTKGCSICAGKKILIGFNDFASQSPHLLSQWHPTKNLPLLPTEITPKNSTKKIWWVCNLGHEWQSKTLHRANGSGCPFCSGRNLLAGFNDLASTHPQLLEEWHPTRNLPLLPTQIAIGKKLKVWWLGKCGHEWESMAYDRYAKKTGCIYCSGFSTLVGFNDIATTHAYLVVEWHPSKNLPLTPLKVTSGSGKKAWWICKEGHEWNTAVSTRATAKRGCPVCSGNKVIQGFNDLASRSPHLMLEWHPTKNTLDPTVVSWSSGLKAWWICKDGHEWETKISIRHNGAGCYVCGGIRGALALATPKPGINDLASQFPKIAAEWSHRNLPKTPDMFRSGSKTSVWWECPKGHEWQVAIHSRTSRGTTGCPTCAPNIYISRQEATIKSFLESLGLTVETSDRKILKGKEIDLYIPEKKFGIEFNGIYWHTEKNGKGSTYHYDKWSAARSAGVELVQVWEDDFRDRKEAVLRMLAYKLGCLNNFHAMYPEYADKGSTTLSAGLTVAFLPVDVARDFMQENAPQGFRTATRYLGLVDDTSKVHEVMMLDVSATQVCIDSYVSRSGNDNGFLKLLDQVKYDFQGLPIMAFSDNCMSSGELFTSQGFILDREVPPDFVYVVDGCRIAASNYSVERFKNDPELIFRMDLDVSALADANGIPRIWGAGGTLYLLPQKSERTSV